MLGRALQAYERGEEVIDRARLVADLVKHGVTRETAAAAVLELAGLPRGAKKAGDLADDAKDQASRARRQAADDAADKTKREAKEMPCGKQVLVATSSAKSKNSTGAACGGVKVGGDEPGAAETVKVAPSQVQINKQIGDAASDSIAKRFPGARREVTLQTSDGARRIDVLTQQGKAIESKVGRTSLSKETRRQVLKDAELLKDPTSGVNEVVWEFSKSPTTGKGGPTGPLRKFLEDNGIGIQINP